MPTHLDDPPRRWIRQAGDHSAVVFVHGLLSDGEHCWRHDNATYWPELVANEDSLAKTGIYVFSYQTAAFSGRYSIGDAVEALHASLKLDGLLKLRTLVFVCHSMGGIIARQFLVTRQAALIRDAMRIGLFLVASPSLGSSYANLFSFLGRALGHAQAAALRFSQDNTWLNDLDVNFRNLKESNVLKMAGQELIEDKSVVLSELWRKQVVEPFSGSRYFGDSIKIPGSDHFSIAKPCDRDALQHRLLVQFAADCCAATAPGVVTHAAGVASNKDTRIRVRQIEPAADPEWREFRSTHVTIGRGPENDIVLDDPKVSWDHGVLGFERGAFLYRHLSRTNPTEVRGRGRAIRLEKDGVEETMLVDRDRITVGRVILTVECSGGGAEGYIPTDDDADLSGT